MPRIGVWVIAIAAGSLILGGSVVERQDTTTGLPRVAYYGKDLTWQQIEDLQRQGKALFGISWDGIEKSAAFDTEAEVMAFQASLIATTKVEVTRAYRTSSPASPPPRPQPGTTRTSTTSTPRSG